MKIIIKFESASTLDDLYLYPSSTLARWVCARWFSHTKVKQSEVNMMRLLENSLNALTKDKTVNIVCAQLCEGGDRSILHCRCRFLMVFIYIFQFVVSFSPLSFHHSFVHNHLDAACPIFYPFILLLTTHLLPVSDWVCDK